MKSSAGGALKKPAISLVSILKRPSGAALGNPVAEKAKTTGGMGVSALKTMKRPQMGASVGPGPKKIKSPSIPAPGHGSSVQAPLKLDYKKLAEAISAKGG